MREKERREIGRVSSRFTDKYDDNIKSEQKTTNRNTISEGNALEGVRLVDGVLDQGLVPRHVPRSAAVSLGCPARVPNGPSLFHLVAAAAVPLSSIHQRPAQLYIWIL